MSHVHFLGGGSARFFFSGVFFFFLHVFEYRDSAEFRRWVTGLTLIERKCNVIMEKTASIVCVCVYV